MERSGQGWGEPAGAGFKKIDAQSVKNTDTAGLKGYDAGKKVSGIKRHIDVDTQGFPHAVVVTAADVTDRQGALQAFKRCKSSLHQVKSVLTLAVRSLGIPGYAASQIVNTFLGLGWEEGQQ